VPFASRRSRAKAWVSSKTRYARRQRASSSGDLTIRSFSQCSAIESNFVSSRKTLDAFDSCRAERSWSVAIRLPS
jgi:hypothetical protein